jgi:two-component system, cell cycle sensor histidine kinase and response regulator CckA
VEATVRRAIDGGYPTASPDRVVLGLPQPIAPTPRLPLGHRGSDVSGTAGESRQPGADGDLATLEVLFDAHPDPLFVLDRAGRFLRGNAAFVSLAGCETDDLERRSYHEFVHPDERERVDAEFGRALAGETRRYETRGVTALGRRVLVHVTNVPVEHDGEVARVLGIVSDISEREAAREALEASERRFRGLFEGAGAGMAIADLEGRFVEANEAYMTMLGYREEELTGLTYLDVTHPDDREDDRRQVAELLAGDLDSYLIEKRYLAADGATVWARAHISLIRDGAGEPLHLAATTEDITGVKRAEERLRRSEGLRRLAGQLARVGGWSVDAADRELDWSEEVFAIVDAPSGVEVPSLEEAIALYPTGHRERLAAAVEAALTDGTPFDLELEVDTFAGRRLPVRVLGEPERDATGAITRIFGAFQDISALREATRSAEEAAARLRVTLESMTDALYTLDRDWRFTFLNQRAAELLRCERDEVLGQVVWEAFPGSVESPLFEAYHRAIEDQETQILEGFHYPSLGTWFSANVYPSEQGVAVYFRDVTEAHRARVALEEREVALERQAALLDEARDAIIVRDADHRVAYWNRGAERLYGWSAQEVMGTDIRELLDDDPAAFDVATAEVMAQGYWSGEVAQRTRDGAPVVVAGRWTLVRDDDGRPEAILAINTDITEQQRVEQQLLRAQRMESIGTLAGGVAHDLNNVLSPILLAAELLELRASDDVDVDLLDTIAVSARRGADMVRQVLSFARGVEGQRSPVDVTRLLREVRVLVRDTFPKDVTFRLQAPDQVPGLIGDSTQIQQVLVNLVVNARDAMPEGGTLTITVTPVTLDAQHVAGMPGSTPGGHLLIEVEDTGSGMPPEVAERVFEPFFTTKPPGSGTGLGLSTSAAIVRSHGGFVRVDSEPGRGSRFSLYLPIDRGEAPVDPVPALDPELPRGDGRTVLVVDDEEAVRAMTRRTLETYGYGVLEARDGAEAVAVFAQHRDHVDVVLTDMLMPVMDGPTTIHALRSVTSDLRIIGASGLHGDGKVAQAASAGVEHFLTKPYTSRSLLDTLAEALDDAPPAP